MTFENSPGFIHRDRTLNKQAQELVISSIYNRITDSLRSAIVLYLTWNSPPSFFSTAVDLSLNQLYTARDFCQQPVATKLLLLKQRGLERYSKLLSQMQATPGNLACLEQFLSGSSQIKFPTLQGTDLAGLDLSGFNLIRANLTDADLRGAYLIAADMMFSNLTRANLQGANLQGATLQEVRWSGAIVQDCDLRHTKGIAPHQQQWLRENGAIF
jgi:hypothetical protein